MSSSLRVAGLFAGIGGIELGFQRATRGGVDTPLLCEWWQPAQRVLAAHFPGVPVHADVRDLRTLPDVDVVTAGFPCTDLSQAGRTQGIAGSQSSLVGHVFQALRLAVTRGRRLPWLVIENVPNMLALDRGRAMAYLVGELDALGYRWAYRVVDSRCVGVPQRRRRVLMVASRTEDPTAVLFSDDTRAADEGPGSGQAFGFYWTEGKGGLGWAPDAVPTLKGGSTIGIPSPPAVWVPAAETGRKIVTPQIEDAEALQGFPRGWTAVSDSATRRGPRWKLVGNAVTVDVAGWLAGRLVAPGAGRAVSSPAGAGAWPRAAWGERGAVYAVDVSEFPVRAARTPLLDVMDRVEAPALSHRGTSGFFRRLNQGNLGRHPGFREDVAEHVRATGHGMAPLAL